MTHEILLEELLRQDLQFVADVTQPSSDTLEVKPLHFEGGFGFRVKAMLQKKRLRIEFLPGKFSKTLLDQIPATLQSNSTAFKMQLKRMELLDGKLSMFNLDEKIAVEDLVKVQQIGSDFKIIFKLGRRENIFLDDEKYMTSILEFFSLVLLMVPTYYNHDMEESISVPDGSVIKVYMNIYERNPVNRRLCIEHHGSKCKVCNFDFYKSYGELGRGFIHVHHILELSQCNKAYVPDPVNDLVPVCPNCHSMLHRQKPALSVKALQEKLR